MSRNYNMYASFLCFCPALLCTGLPLIASTDSWDGAKRHSLVFSCTVVCSVTLQGISTHDMNPLLCCTVRH